MVIELTSQFIPKEFPHREIQIKEIKETFENFKKFKYGSNLLINGTTGSGKTSCINKIMNEEDNHIYLSAANEYTTHKLLKKMSGLKTNDISELLKRTIAIFKKEPRVIILDEITKITDLAKLMNSLNTIYRETNCPMIILTNSRDFMSQVPDDAKKTLNLVRVDFPCYNALQLKDILDYRLNLVKDKSSSHINEITEECKMMIAALIKSEHGSSVRTMLDMTLNCILKNKYSQDFIRETDTKLKEQEQQQFIQGLNDTEKKFLNIVLELSDNNNEIPMRKIAHKMQNLTPGRISQLVKAFTEDYTILECARRSTAETTGTYKVLFFPNSMIKESLWKAMNPWE